MYVLSKLTRVQKSMTNSSFTSSEREDRNQAYTIKNAAVFHLSHYFELFLTLFKGLMYIQYIFDKLNKFHIILTPTENTSFSKAFKTVKWLRILFIDQFLLPRLTLKSHQKSMKYRLLMQKQESLDLPVYCLSILPSISCIFEIHDFTCLAFLLAFRSIIVKSYNT